jgi:hypothetical protein
VTHIGHLLRWDARRTLVYLVVWTVLVVAAAVVGVVGPLVVAQPWLADQVDVIALLVWLTMLVLGFALVSFVVHGHPAVGTDAFWMTRPIPARGLFAAKLLLITVVVLMLPLTSQAAQLALTGMPWLASAGVIADSLAFRAPLIFALVFAATLTRNLARFAVLCGGTLLTMIAAIAIFVAIELSRIDQSPVVDPDRQPESAAGMIVFDVLFVAGVIIAIAVQYSTRLRRRSVAIAIGASVAAYFVSAAWPVDFLSQRLVVPDWARQSNTLTLSVDPATVSTNTPHAFFNESARRWSTVNGVVRISPPERGWMAAVGLRDAEVSLPTGTTLRSPGTWGSPVLFAADGATRLTEHFLIRDVLEAAVLGNALPAEHEDAKRPENLPVLFLMPRTELSGYAGARGHYRGRFNVTLTHLAIDGVLPIERGAVHRSGAYRLVIDDITSRGGEAAIVAREAQARSMWDRRPWTRYRFYLRNPARKQAVEVSDYAMHRASLLRFLPFGNVSFGVGAEAVFGFSSRGLILSFPARYTPRGDTIDVDQEWLAGAELVILRQTQEGSVERTLEIPDFPL